MRQRSQAKMLAVKDRHAPRRNTLKEEKMKTLRTLAVSLLLLAISIGTATAQTWQGLKNKAPFNAGAMLLLTDGRVMVHSEQASPQNWWTLTPDNTGSYVNGTWTQIASMPSGYAPLYFGSVVLNTGIVVVEGGEYNNGSASWTNLGAAYNPKSNKWISINPPSGWAQIGDAPSAILPDGTYLQADCCDTPPKTALFNPSTKSWTSTGTGKFDVYDEEGLTLLPNGNLLDVDAYVFVYNSAGTNSEIYNTSSGTWSSAGSTVKQLWDSAATCGGSGNASFEEGPDVLRPDGTVFATGANACGAGHTAIYNSSTGVWTAGPDFTGSLDVADGPAALETNGNVIVMTSPGIFGTGAQFFEWNGTALNTVAGPPNAHVDSSFYGHFLELPTGQLLFTDFSTDVEVFTPSGTYQTAWQPTITRGPVNVTHGHSYQVQGTQFNGLSQGAAYGDDFQDATNYPLVRIVNNATGHAVYCRTHNHSSMGVQTGSTLVSTHFDVPTTIETGASTLYVVANGIPSAPFAVNVQ